MLTVSQINNVNYYTELAKDDYYLDSGEPNGIWVGRGARLLGLQGLVDTEEYRNIMYGFTPDGENVLCTNPGQGHRHGYDLTFSAPKSVSVAWARVDEQFKVEIQDAQQSAVSEVLSFLEEHAGVTRRAEAGRCREKVLGFVASTFEHATSREQDPQLHTHCLIANVAPRIDGSWGTIESHDVYLWQKAAGALYRAELAKSLRTMGFTVEKDNEAFRLAEVPEDICAYYSKRKHIIEEELSKRGGIKACSKGGDIVSLATRRKKDVIVRSDLYQNWSNELDSQGFSNEILKQNMSLIKQESNSFNLRDIEQSLTESKSIFRRQDVYMTSAILSQYGGKGSKHSIEMAEAFLSGEQVVYLGEDIKYNELFSTREMVECERRTIETAKLLAHKHDYSISQTSIEKAITSKEFLVSEEQQESIYAVCAESNFAIMQGSAGAGKSASMSCVRQAYEDEGYTVVGAAIARSAANNLSEEAGIHTHTVAKLLTELEKGESIFNSRTVLLIDEAGQVGTRHLDILLQAADHYNTKVVLIGEDKQLDAIQHGGMLKYLSRPEVVGTTRIESIRRQRQEWSRETVANFRDGKALQAITEYDKRGYVHFSDNGKTTKEELIRAWTDYRADNPDNKSMILAQRWADVTELNVLAREVYKSEGIIGYDDIGINCSISNKVLLQNMSTGERIKFTRNDYRMGFTNGDLGTISCIEQVNDEETYFSVIRDDGREVSFKSSDYSDKNGNVYLTHAYAQTVYSSQGITIDGDVFVYYTTGMDRAHTYVACSRHKDNCHIFSNTSEFCLENDDIDRSELLSRLSFNMSNDVKSGLAIEFLSKNEQELGYISLEQNEMDISF